MKRLHYLFYVVLGTLFLTSCLKDPDGPTPSYRYGGMIFINAYPEAHGVYFRIDEKTVQFPTTDYIIPYKSIGPLVGLYSGSRRFEVFSENFGSKTPIIDTSITVTDSTYYSSIVYGDKESPKYLLATDTELKDLDQGSGIRFFNLANELDEATLLFDDKAVEAFTDRAQESDSTLTTTEKFLALSSGGQTLTAKDKEGNEIAKRENFQFQKGRYYSIILIGSKSNADTPYYIGIVPH